MMPAPSALSLFWENVQVFWLTWDLEIACGLIFVGGVYFLMRWLLRRFPDYFFEREKDE
jgi:hypothetical protein